MFLVIQIGLNKPETKPGVEKVGKEKLQDPANKPIHPDEPAPVTGTSQPRRVYSNDEKEPMSNTPLLGSQEFV